MIVEVTEYRLPDGHQHKLKTNISDDLAEKYKELLSCGCRLAVEVLRTQEISQTIEHPEFDFDIALTGGKDTDENKRVMEEMIRRFDKNLFNEKLKGLDNG